VTIELDILLGDPVFTIMVKCELLKSNIHCRAAIPKSLITEINDKRQKYGVIIIQPGCLMIEKM
jgi:hypothetical protein